MADTNIRPLDLYRAGERRYPGIYRDLEAMERANGAPGLRWPDCCILPINAAFTALVGKYGASTMEAARYAAEITGAYCWDKHRIIYNVDTALAGMLAEQAADTADTDVLPSELLMRLPYPCVYLALPGLNAELDGALVWIDHDTNRDAPELRAQYCYRDGATEAGVLHLVPGTIGDCIADTNAEILRNAGGDAPRLGGADSREMQRLLTVIQIILYIVSDASDVEMRTPPRLSRRRDRRKGKPKEERPITTGAVGIHIGAAIRRQKQRPAPEQGGTGAGAPKRPHTRRGHWHHYWVGAHDTPERRLVLKWTPPTLIHPDDGGKGVWVYPVR